MIQRCRRRRQSRGRREGQGKLIKFPEGAEALIAGKPEAGAGVVSQRELIFLIKIFKGGGECISEADHCPPEGMGFNCTGPCGRGGGSEGGN